MTKKVNPYVRNGLIQARVGVKEMQGILAKSVMYSKGNVGAFIRLACAAYRPLKKNEGRKMKKAKATK